MVSDELRRLGNQIEALKYASMFNAKEVGESCLSCLMRVLTDMEERLQRVEKLYANVEIMRDG